MFDKKSKYGKTKRDLTLNLSHRGEAVKKHFILLSGKKYLKSLNFFDKIGKLLQFFWSNVKNVSLF